MNEDKMRRLIADSISSDDRKQVAEEFLEAGGKLADLSDETYSALLAVAEWGAERVLFVGSDEAIPEGGPA